MEWIFPSPISSDTLSTYEKTSPFLAELLYRRNIMPEDLSHFIDNTRSLNNPFLLPDMKKTVDRLFLAYENKERICIWGDYDADGLTSQAILFLALQEWGFEDVLLYTPNRLYEGYGLNTAGLKMLAKEGVTLTIALDLGTSNYKEVEDGRNEEMEIIIVDHHAIPAILPQSFSFINPHLAINEYGDEDFAACGLTYMLVRALSNEFGPLCEETAEFLRALVALGTVADMAPLVGENRVLVINGLEAIRHTNHVGLRSLIHASHLNIETITEESIGFDLGPRINVAGRMKHPEIVRNILLPRSQNDAYLTAMTLNKLNIQRKAITVEMMKTAIAQIESLEELPNVIIVKSEEWGAGFVGLLAGKIAERYHRPTIALRGNLSNWKGSARSIPQFDIIKALRACEGHLGQFGGHPAAAGLEVKRENLAAFHEQMNEEASILPKKDLFKSVTIDMIIPHEKVTRNSVREIEKIAPFGVRNKNPIFLFKEVTVVSSGVTKDGIHLNLKIRLNDGRIIEAMKFFSGEQKWMLVNKKKYDLCGSLSWNTYSGNERLKINVADFRPSDYKGAK